MKLELCLYNLNAALLYYVEGQLSVYTPSSDKSLFSDRLEEYLCLRKRYIQQASRPYLRGRSNSRNIEVYMAALLCSQDRVESRGGVTRRNCRLHIPQK